MNPSNQRLTELLDRWLASIELHGKYALLDDASYWRVQQWPPHDRPSPRVIELARLRLLDLRKQVATRSAAGDAQFVAALELMSFLAPLLGSDSVTRGIPLASATPQAAPRPVAPSVAVAQPSPAATIDPRITATVVADAIRMLNWGRQWPELAGLIARLADRPPESTVWVILRAHRTAIMDRMPLDS